MSSRAVGDPGALYRMQIGVSVRERVLRAPNAFKIPAQGLDLFASGVKGRLANVAAKGCSGEILVVPGDAAASYLMAKLEGTHGEDCGAQMPKGGSPMPSAKQNCIATWIDAMAASSPGGGDSGDDSDDSTPGGGGGGGW